ncbi:cyclic nucleotide-binding domain protein (macronuclear) [Tetrahymena thermophila SB210]|uniref:Cyclic nucleotide-binding domain protein n=1 Tax=Tetrahymena thermophila (strain SB210) TaxID=312017 RepID=I7MLG4_TETTS|nr:cyclic nucleotide-binding domain protein [Tetrahymena thermophila SB210]EAS02050.4 cyclic nucleotide-binding domain protein [Tetrahymena thermophila SB210]|eukprot:XP_001022295.4 cyclic nucleotide-binding domain protein [Tetrahymena thermophila SB210]
MNEGEQDNQYSKIRDELFLLQSRTQKETQKKNLEIKQNLQKTRNYTDVISIMQVNNEYRTLIQRQKLQNYFRYTTFFQKLLKKNSLEKIQGLIEKCADRVQYRFINQGDIVYKYMEKADSVYFIIRGEVSVLIPKKYEQIEDEKQNKLQLQKNTVSTNQNQKQQQYQSSFRNNESQSQISGLNINMNQAYNDDFRIASLADIPLDSSFQKDHKKYSQNQNSIYHLSPKRSAKLKRGALISSQQFFFQEGMDASPVKSIDNIRRLNSMSLIQEMEVNKTRSFNMSPKKQNSNCSHSIDRNQFSSAAARALFSPEKLDGSLNQKKDENFDIDIQGSEILSSEKQPLLDNNNNGIQQFQSDTEKNQQILQIKLFKSDSNYKNLGGNQSYFNNQDFGYDGAERMITSFSQIPHENNDVISEKSEIDSIIGENRNNQDLSDFRLEQTKKLSNLEKVFMSEPEFQLCFGSLYPHEINNCALYFFDGNTFKYNFGQRLKENQNTDTIDLIQKQPRSTTCVALTPLQLAQLDKNDYNDILKDIEEINLWRKIDQICKSFDTEKVPNLRKMIADIFPFLQKVVFQKGQLIFQQGEFTRGCFIIKKGEIELTKWSIIDPPEEFQKENQFRNWQSFCYPQEITLSLITPGQFFGEEDMLRNRRFRSLNAKCKSSECTLYFISKIHFLRILYESNILVDIFVNRSKLKDKWHKEKYEKIIQILKDDYSKRLGRNLFEEKKKEILGKKKREEIEKEKKDYNQMTGMFRDTYEKMTWKMSVADELNFPFKQLENQEASEKEKTVQDNKNNDNQNQIRSYKQSRSNSTDSVLISDSNSQKKKIKQYGRLIIQKGSKQTFLEEKMAILANLQERQMRQLAKKKQILPQKTIEEALSKTNLVQKSLQNSHNLNTSSTIQNTKNNSEKQSSQDQKQLKQTTFINHFSKQYIQWKKKSNSVEKIQKQNQNLLEKDQNENQQILIENKDNQNEIHENAQQLNPNSNKDKKILSPDKIQKQDFNSLQAQAFLNQFQQQKGNKTNDPQVNVKGKQIHEDKLLAKINQDQDDETEIQKQETFEKQQQLMATLTCKIQGFQEDLQLKINKMNNKDQLQMCNDLEKKLPVDFKIKTARSQAEAIASHYMNILNEQEKVQKKKKNKKVKRNKLDIIEYRLKGQVWAVMQMKRELAKFEIKKQLTLKNEKSKQVIRSLSSPPVQQEQISNQQMLKTNTQIREQDSKFHNIFEKIKNQIIQIQQDKFNQNNVYIPAFSVFPYTNNAEYILSHPLLNSQADKTSIAFKSTDHTQQVIGRDSLQREQKVRSQTEETHSRKKQNDNKKNLDELMIKEWNQALQIAQQKQNIINQENINDLSLIEFQQPSSLSKQNSIQKAEPRLQLSKDIINVSSEEEDNIKDQQKSNHDRQNNLTNEEQNFNLLNRTYQNTFKSEQKNKSLETNQKQRQPSDCFRKNLISDQKQGSNIVNYHTSSLNRNKSHKSYNQEQQKSQNSSLMSNANFRKRILSQQFTQQEQLQQQFKSIEDNIKQNFQSSNSFQILKNLSNKDILNNQVNEQTEQEKRVDIHQIKNLNNIETQSTIKQLAMNGSRIVRSSSSSLNNKNGISISKSNLITKINNKINQIKQEESYANCINLTNSFLTAEQNNNNSNSQYQITNYFLNKNSNLQNIQNQKQTTNKGDKIDGVMKVINESQLNYLKKMNIQNKPNSLVITNHQGKPITYKFK